MEQNAKLKRGDVVRVTPQVNKHSNWIVGFGPVIARVICQTPEGVLLENKGSFIDMFDLDEISYITDAAHDCNHEFKPFDRVIVKNGCVWEADIFSHYGSGNEDEYKYCCIGVGGTDDCVPYEGNEELVGLNTRD